MYFLKKTTTFFIAVVLFAVAQTAVAALDVNYNSDEELIEISGNAEIYDEDKFYNQIGVSILRPDMKVSDLEDYTMDEVYYYFGEATAFPEDAFSFNIPFEGTKGLYTVRITMPYEKKPVEKELFCATKEDFQLLLGDINTAIRNEDTQKVKQLISENTVMLGIENDVYKKLCTLDEEKGFFDEVSAAVSASEKESMAVLKADIMSELSVQLMKRFDNVNDAEKFLDENEAQLIASGRLYSAYVKNKGESAYKKEVCDKLRKGSFKNLTELVEYFDKQAVLCGAQKLVRSKLQLMIEDNSSYMSENGMDISSYNSLSANKKAEAVSDITDTSFATVADMADAFNKAVEEASQPSSGTDSGGSNRGSSSDRGGTISRNDIIPVVPYEKAPFNDLANVPWAAEAIEALFDKGIISGKGDGKFAPGDNIKREEFAKIAVLALNVAQNEYSSGEFEDATENEWFAPYVYAAKDAGLIKGISESSFGSGRDITREDIAVILYRASHGQLPQKVQRVFADEAHVADYAKDAVKALSDAGIINGDENSCFNPKKSATRAECAKMIFEYLKLTESEGE